jgi:capsular exopolysaccharide synthesis family protein
MSNLRDALRKAEEARRALKATQAEQASASRPAEAVEAAEVVDVVEAAEVVDVVGAAEVVDVVGAAEVVDVVDAAEVAELREFVEAAEVVAAAEPAEAAEPDRQIKGLGSHRIVLPVVPPAFAAEVDMFRQGVESALPGPTRRILMTSATAGEGVTTLSLFVAISLAARAGRSVCIVDADLKSSGLTRMLGLQGQLGVSDVCQGLADWSDALRPTDTEGLYVVGTGRAEGEPSVLLGSTAGREMAANLATRFEYVLIDGGRTLGQVEASLLAPNVDGTVLVVRANHTKREVLAKAEAEIRSHGGRVVGSILNRRTFPIPAAVYRRL